MTMALDTSQQQRFGPGGLSFEYPSHAQPPPAFSNPWSSSSSSSSSTSPPQSIPTTIAAAAAAAVGAGGGALYNVHGGPPPSSVPPPMMACKPLPPSARASTGSISSMASYGSMPIASSAASHHQHQNHHTSGASLAIHQHDLLNSASDMMAISRLQSSTGPSFGGEPAYPTSSASPVNGHFASPTTTGPYEAIGYAAAPTRQHAFPLGPEDGSRRLSHSAMPPSEDNRSFADALDASHGMLAMSQETPRNIYGSARHDRSSVDSYGFPSTHSTSSSISSTGNLSSYYGDSVSDYSTGGSDHDSRTLPRPQGLLSGAPPAAASVAATAQLPPVPQSMMGQFSSKVSSSTQKKHKCHICDKRFTRPSSLQTHMYSHTGEKPFACEVEGCGRHFSVVSNLRRHHKVHKIPRGDARSEAGSEDHHSD